MTVDTSQPLPPQATKSIGSSMSPYRLYQAIDPQTGDWYDVGDEFSAREIERMLETDGRARAVEQVLTLPLRAAPLTIKGAKGDSGEAEWVNTSLEGMTQTPLRLVVGQAAQSLIFRTTYLEKIFTVDSGEVEYQALAWRPPDSCALRRDRKTGQITGFRQEIWGEPLPVQIPASKSALFIHGANRDPVRGVSEMAVSYRCWRDKQKLRALWMILLERAAAPWVIAKTANGDEDSVSKTLAKMRAGGVAALSNLDSVDVLNVAGESARVFQAAVQFLDSEMAGSVLAGFLDLASAAGRGAGSLALSQDQTDFYASSMDAAAREIAESFRQQIVMPLLQYNRGPRAVIPDVTLGPIGGATSEQLLTLVQAFASAPAGQSIFPKEFIDEIVLRVAGTLDLDLDKIQTAITSMAETTAAASPASAGSAPLHAAVTTLDRAAAEPNQFKKRSVIGLSVPDADPKAVELDDDAITWIPGIDDPDQLDLASVDGHHVAGTAYHWRHGWHPIDVYTALKHRLRREARALHAAGAAFHHEEPEHIEGTPRQVPHPHGHVVSGKSGDLGKLTPAAPGEPKTPHGSAPVSDAITISAKGQVGKSVKSAVDAVDKVHGDGGLNPIPIKSSAAKAKNGVYEHGLRPNEDVIRVSSYGDHQELTTAHEIGHWIDSRALSSIESMKPDEGSPRTGSMFASRVTINALRSPTGVVSMNKTHSGQKVSSAWKEWGEAVIDSGAIKTIFDLTKHPENDPNGSAKYNRVYLNYLLKAEEIWARSYAQYIANKSGNKAMLDGVDNLRGNAKSLVRHSQWSNEDFVRIEAAIDGVLEEQGWRK